MNEKIRNKKVEESLTETTKLLQYKEINGQNRLFGGRLMEFVLILTLKILKPV